MEIGGDYLSLSDRPNSRKGGCLSQFMTEKKSRNRKEAQSYIAASDETQIRVRDADEKQVAWFYLVHGIQGHLFDNKIPSAR